jgi:hypothetical protein
MNKSDAAHGLLATTRYATPAPRTQRVLARHLGWRLPAPLAKGQRATNWDEDTVTMSSWAGRRLQRACPRRGELTPLDHPPSPSV